MKYHKNKNESDKMILKNKLKQFVNKKKLLKILFYFFMIFICSTSKAEDKPWLLSKGTAAREAKRFNLYDWLEQKNRNKVMDMWLSLNTASPYEFLISTHFNQYKLTNKPQADSAYENYSVDLHAYSYFVGLTGEYENNTFEHFALTTGIFNLRVFGETLQGSQITFRYGLRTKTDHNQLFRLNQTFAAALVQLNIFSGFGLHYEFRHYFPFTESYLGDTRTESTDVAAYIDFGDLRIQ